MSRLHHVQVSCPAGGENAARAFWVDALGLTEVEKPEPLRGRGGCWFRSYDAKGEVSAEIHVGVDTTLVEERAAASVSKPRPAAKAHLALVVDDLDAVVVSLRAAGHPVDLTEGETFPGYSRLHTTDPHGNRVEILSELHNC